MKIGIDISQIAYKGTGVATYLQNLVENLIAQDRDNDYILFYSSLRKDLPLSRLWSQGPRINSDNLKPGLGKITISQFKFPPTLLDFIWNRLHLFPIEWFIGNVDVFISSDWTQPPTIKAKKVTILYDLIVYKYPNETAKKIVNVQKRKLRWVKKECDKVICISNATKTDAIEILGISKNKLSVVYPGVKNILNRSL